MRMDGEGKMRTRDDPSFLTLRELGGGGHTLKISRRFKANQKALLKRACYVNRRLITTDVVGTQSIHKFKKLLDQSICEWLIAF